MAISLKLLKSKCFNKKSHKFLWLQGIAANFYAFFATTIFDMKSYFLLNPKFPAIMYD